MLLRETLCDSSRAAIDAAVALAEKQPALFEEALLFACHEPYPMAMRAARVIQLYGIRYPRSLEPFLEKIVDALLHNKVDGVKRSFLKVLIEVVAIDKIPDAGLIYSRCLDWVFSAKESIAVRAYSMDLLYKFTLFEKELSHEFILVLENVPLDQSPGLDKRRKHFLGRLKKLP